jgi:16S rRNA (cytosine967-C5)-methyltransferase
LRSASIEIIARVEAGAFLDDVINSFFSHRDIPDSMKGLVYTMASGAVRHKGYFDWVLARLVKREMKKDVRYLFWISLYQIAHMKKAHYHVVMEAVEYGKRHFSPGTAPFVNAVLRRFIRERDLLVLPENPVTALSIEKSFPRWLVSRWVARFGHEETDRLLTLLNEPPDFTLRIDLARITKQEVVALLEAQGVRVREGKYLESALHVDKLGPVLKDPLFLDGLISVQDEASQLVAQALPPSRGPVLDACAGVGTKAGQIRGLFRNTLVIAMDNDMGRISKMKEKSGLIVQGDSLQTPYRAQVFDTILLDAPCSSLGIVRKHPEIKWRRDEREVIAFGNYQLDLMRSLWDNLRSGGAMVYSVCSFEPEETVGVIERFGREKEFLLENPLPFCSGTEYFLSLPHVSGMDGFFIAKLRKP